MQTLVIASNGTSAVAYCLGGSMRGQPYLEDPSEAVLVHLTKAISTPMRELAAIHIDLALHQAELAAACGVALNLPDLRGRMKATLTT